MLAAHGDGLGLDRDAALRLGNAFGGGMGLTGGTCGAVTGAFMILGLRFGAYDAGDKASRARTYELVRRFTSEFSARNGSVICRELLGFDIASKDSIPDAGKIIAGKCPALIMDAACILGDIFDREGEIHDREKGRNRG